MIRRQLSCNACHIGSNLTRFLKQISLKIVLVARIVLHRSFILEQSFWTHLSVPDSRLPSLPPAFAEHRDLPGPLTCLVFGNPPLPCCVVEDFGRKSLRQNYNKYLNWSLYHIVQRITRFFVVVNKINSEWAPFTDFFFQHATTSLLS